MGKTIICYCKNVSKETIVKAITHGASTLKEIQEISSACTGNKCKELHPKGRCCSTEILNLLKEYGKDSPKTKCSCD